MILDRIIDEFKDEESRLQAQLDLLRTGRAALEGTLHVKTPRLRPKAAVTAGALRGYFMEYPEFTRAEMAEHFGRTKNWTYDALKPFLHKGTVQMVAANDNRELVFAFQRPVAKSTPRNRLKPKAQSVSEPVPGTGKQKKVSARKEIRSIVDTARAQGYMVVTQGDGHIKVVHPSDPGKKATLASTPAMGETNGKRQLQSIGVKF